MLSPVIVSRIQRKYSKHELHQGIINEIKYVQYTLVCTAHLLCTQYGKYDKEFIKWCIPLFESHKDEEGVNKVLKTLNTQLLMSDDQFSYLADALKAKAHQSKGLKKVNLAFSEMHLAEISAFSIEFQSLLFELRSKLSFINEEIETAHKYHFMTYDSSLTPENHKIVTMEINSKYVFIQEMIVRAVDTISEIINFKAY